MVTRRTPWGGFPATSQPAIGSTVGRIVSFDRLETLNLSTGHGEPRLGGPVSSYHGRWFRIAAIIGCLALAGRLAATEGYEIQDILTASSPTASRSQTWKPGEGLALEVSGMDFTADRKLAVAIRKGEVWLIDGVEGAASGKMGYTLFASGLHEPLGVLRDGDGLLVAQRTEVTRLRDTNGDGVADEYLTAARGWNVSGAYHGYTYGPKRDGQGNLWVALNLDMGERTDNTAAWRGWGGVIGPDGTFKPMVAGMRSPCGLGANSAGDMFCVDQQGTWIPSTPIYHLRQGAFFSTRRVSPPSIGPTLP